MYNEKKKTFRMGRHNNIYKFGGALGKYGFAAYSTLELRFVDCVCPVTDMVFTDSSGAPNL